MWHVDGGAVAVVLSCLAPPINVARSTIDLEISERRTFTSSRLCAKWPKDWELDLPLRRHDAKLIDDPANVFQTGSWPIARPSAPRLVVG